jgi:hypothetical protein
MKFPSYKRHTDKTIVFLEMDHRETQTWKEKRCPKEEIRKGTLD